jgi:hypothetical protein
MAQKKYETRIMIKTDSSNEDRNLETWTQNVLDLISSYNIDIHNQNLTITVS